MATAVDQFEKELKLIVAAHKTILSTPNPGLNLQPAGQKTVQVLCKSVFPVY
ncbi:hypothetical protein SCP_0606930 [Sparassis crispa]|uniref:Uncharacterized protein n=1 Tax=Sparassis crispa TaxID=139825 RepID=A0A401GR81_9APHY|nr:hypothetical protein SCP_0606930 [Sparassis crispa]GBE84713.1 hypothetical protein SCP_0606930 [Sparassis crispa]